MDVLVWRKGLIELGVQRKIGQKNKTWWGMLGKGLQVGAFRCMAGGGEQKTERNCPSAQEPSLKVAAVPSVNPVFIFLCVQVYV